MSEKTNRVEKPNIEAKFASAMFYSVATGNPSDAILASESRGQRQLVMSDSIPASWGVYGDAEEVARLDGMLAGLGFEVGEPFPDDPIFRPARLPEGWRKSATAHAMHSDILDDQGFARIGVFFKAAFYDRSAHMSFHRRVGYTYDQRLPVGEKSTVGRVVYAHGKGDRMTMTIIATFRATVGEGEDRWQVGSRLEKEAGAYLAEHYPDHSDPLAYWDIEPEGETFTRELA